jgi:transcriptional regulator with XRE-family HTH domain
MRIRVGKNRQPWRIREFLESKGMNQADVSREVGVSQHVMSETIRGIRNSRKVLVYLRDQGCPVKHLDLPEDLKPQDES